MSSHTTFFFFFNHSKLKALLPTDLQMLVLCRCRQRQGSSASLRSPASILQWLLFTPGTTLEGLQMSSAPTLGSALAEPGQRCPADPSLSAACPNPSAQVDSPTAALPALNPGKVLGKVLQGSQLHRQGPGQCTSEAGLREGSQAASTLMQEQCPLPPRCKAKTSSERVKLYNV